MSKLFQIRHCMSVCSYMPAQCEVMGWMVFIYAMDTQTHTHTHRNAVGQLMRVNQNDKDTGWTFENAP